MKVFSVLARRGRVSSDFLKVDVDVPSPTGARARAGPRRSLSVGEILAPVFFPGAADADVLPPFSSFGWGRIRSRRRRGLVLPLLERKVKSRGRLSPFFLPYRR